MTIVQATLETITIVSVSLERKGCKRQESKVESYCNILSIEKYLDGCVKILSLGRFFYFLFFLSFISCIYCYGTRTRMQR